MSDWIKVRAGEIRLAEKQKKEERERQIEAANVLTAKMEPFWNDLLNVLRSSVEAFNKEFPEAERAIDKVEKPSPSNLTIRRSVYPAAFVKIQLGNGSTSVKYSISRTQRKGTDPIESDGSLSLGLNNGEPAYMGNGVSHHEDVAKLCLEPFFQF